MRFESFVARRYLFSLHKQSFISVISIFAVLGVGLGVAALIVVLGVMSGFTSDLRDKILGVNAHIYVASYSGGIQRYEPLVEKADKVPGVVSVTPFIYSEVMLSTRNGVKGVVLRGVDPKTAGSVWKLSMDPKAENSPSFTDLEKKTSFPGIIIGKELARRLNLSVGGRVNLLSPSGQKSAAGFTPKVKTFQVAGVFSTGMFEYDTTLAYVSIDAARDLLGIGADMATVLEVRVQDVYDVGPVSERLVNALGGFPLYAQTWQEMNANLFAALKLEKTAMFIILAMIVLVGSFSIVTTLVMLVMQKTRDISILMSMGAEAGAIRRIFQLQGTLIGVVGTTLGYAIGIPVSLLLKRYQFIKLPPDVYPVDYLPVKLEAPDLILIGVAALALCYLATLYPARRASSLNPAEALRYE
ncbi:MAG: lipoprotein-releasing system permease protein [Desulfovibrionales bacterium]|nr:lipoprotein-releasing system permease protein [Desulfovibrionales bacterium]